MYAGLVGHYNTVTDSFSDANLVGKFDLESFREYLFSSDADTTFSELIWLYVRAVHKSLFGRELPDNLRVVEKSVENTEFALDLRQMFPDAKFLHILRNPYSNLVALRRHRGRRRYPFLGPALASLKNTFYNLYRNRRLLNSYKIIRYEDLLTNTEKTVKDIADYLEIDFMDILLRPTSLGQPWQGNSSRGLQYSGVSGTNLDLWRKEITDLEVHYVTKYFRFLLDEYGYEVITPRRSHFVPVPGESIKTYLLNRAVPYYL